MDLFEAQNENSRSHLTRSPSESLVDFDIAFPLVEPQSNIPLVLIRNKSLLL
jgi:hypothetical protein